ncbi:MAG: hypothetical protein BRC30_00220 [Nanohaloarchaea archaeon SW_7_46_7]|nr:MAG: hypothetical protein BRC30_00220 [Nanohaloarchaea archaeon SW_7_46_7]
MNSKRLHQAVNDLEKIDEETELELEELGDAIHEVEDLHEEHLEEMEKDREFIQDMKDLYQEVRMIQKIDRHMYKIMEAYEGGEINRQAFKKKYVKDEERFMEIIHEIRTELEEMIRMISEEERLTNKDLDKEGAIEELIRTLNGEQSRLQNTHEHMEELVTGQH